MTCSALYCIVCIYVVFCIVNLVSIVAGTPEYHSVHLVLCSIKTTMPDELQTVIVLSLFFDALSVCVYALLRTFAFKLGLKLFNIVKYLFILQTVLLFTDANVILQFVVGYGYLLEFFMLHVSQRQPTVWEIAFRFVTNAVHHMTMIVHTTNAELVSYALCWFFHVYPWLLLLHAQGYKRVYTYVGIVGQIGNCSTFVAAAWLLFSGDWKTLSVAQMAILLQMLVYRGIYTNLLFGVFTTYGCISSATQEKLVPAGKFLTAVVSVAVIIFLFFF